MTAFPWEQEPEQSQPEQPRTVEEIVAMLQRDFAFAVNTTAVKVHSNEAAFRIIVNTPRGQIVPTEKTTFSDGTYVQLQDLGMCQPGVSYMELSDIAAMILNVADGLGLKL